MKKLVGFGLAGAAIGILVAFILLIVSQFAETVYSWGNLITMDSLVMVVFLKIKLMTFVEVKWAIVGFFAISGFILGMFVASFSIVGDIFPAIVKGAFLFSVLSFFFLVPTTDTPAMYYLPIGAVLGAVVGAIVAAIGEI